MSVSLNSECNNKAHTVSINQHTVFISYTTPIGYTGPLGSCRIENYWGPTTGKHFNRLGIKDLPVVSQEELQARLNKIGS